MINEFWLATVSGTLDMAVSGVRFTTGGRL